MDGTAASLNDALERLHHDVEDRRHADPARSRTAKLIATGIDKISQKVGEEAVEVVIEAIRGNRSGVVLESADLLYQLVVLWAQLGITPGEVAQEMERREFLFGIAEKLPKNQMKGQQDSAGDDMVLGGISLSDVTP
jgi:phosphoribosyl-ATP pyrophosphohydrolase